MEPDIAPLAKRLAEENNVNWRQLSGSGPGGRVVERDVLEYLARVMAGEEAIDPTPEPLPEGMAQWPGQDVPRPQPADDFTFDNDFDDVRFAEPETGLARDLTPDAEIPLVKEPRSFIDESILLLDDEGAAPEVWEAEPTLVMEKEPGAVRTQGFDESDGFDESAVVAAKDEGDWRELLSHDEGWPEPAGGMIELEAEPAVAKVEPIVPIAPDEEDWRSFADRDEGDAVWSEAEGLEPEAVTDEAVTDDVQVVPVAWDADDQSLFADSGEPEPDGEMLTPADEAMAPVVAKPVLPDAFAPAFSEDASVAPAIMPGALPLVSYGVLLRRHINLTALAEAQRAAGRELSDGTPIPPTAFLLRAAAKALRREPLGPERSVALAVLSKRGLGARRMDKAELVSFSQLVAAVNEARASETTELEPAALLVADLSEYALDEAVLRVDVPVLTLGRILYDSQEGSYHSTLSLSGEFVAAVGAKLLGEVASLLDSPVQLVL
jgi:pyruvate/2-oxoglutarate dehydrogenase complex dihydrolipoamide acyltransferase (E2) component